MAMSLPGFSVAAFILYLTGAQVRGGSICALPGSTVELQCSAEHRDPDMKWYRETRDPTKQLFWEELNMDGKYSTSNGTFSLRIKDLSKSDETSYCFTRRDARRKCDHKTKVQLADLQVKVLPETGGDKVTLMCDSSCPLSKKPEAYVWYRNGTFLYEDWSHWYQQLVSADQAVRFSCSIKGHKHVRAPEVSVDSITPSCYNVTYVKGQMCSRVQRPVDKPCSITYPKKMTVRRTSQHTVCNTTCSSILIGRLHLPPEPEKNLKFPCSISGLEDLISEESCANVADCWSVNYDRKRVCALLGSSVNLSSQFQHPKNQAPMSKLWQKQGKNGLYIDVSRTPGQVEYHEEMERHNLTFKNMKKKDSGEYVFKLQKQNKDMVTSNFGAVMLVATDLMVMLDAPEATEGQRVTLRCSTSCPLGDSTTYLWYLDKQPLTSPQGRNKELVLDPVSKQDAGNYSCAVETHRHKSKEKTLVVRTDYRWLAAVAGVLAALMITSSLAVCFWIRKKRMAAPPPSTRGTDNTELMNMAPVYENLAPPMTEQHHLPSSTVHFTNPAATPLYSNTRRAQEQVTYAVVNFGRKPAP